jgi:hypothetical protein
MGMLQRVAMRWEKEFNCVPSVGVNIGYERGGKELQWHGENNHH